MTKRVKRQIATFLLVIQLAFSLFAPFAPLAHLIPQAFASDDAQASINSDTFLSFSAEQIDSSNQLVVKSNLEDSVELPYALYYLNDHTTQALKGELVANSENVLFIGTQSNDDFMSHDWQKMVFKVQLGDEVRSYYLQKQTEGELVGRTFITDSLEFSSDDTQWISWLTEADNKTATTIENVVEGQEYLYPFNDKVSVTFTKLPEESGTLTITQLELDEELAQKFGTSVAFDVTTTMENGTFEFDLHLPQPENLENPEAIEVVYADTTADLIVEEKVSKVEKEEDGEQMVEVVEEEGVVKAKGLDHMTVFVVVGDSSDASECSDVYNSYDGSCHETIKAAIDSANEGDEIYVGHTYVSSKESFPITIDKQIKLYGAQKDVDPRPSVGGRSGNETIIDGRGNEILDINADQIEINGFTFTNGGGYMIHQKSGTSVTGTVFSFNIVHNQPGDDAVKLREGSNCTVSYNYIYDTNQDAIGFDGITDGTIAFNEIHNNSSENAAIYVYSSENTLIEGNIIDGTTQNDGIKLGNKGSSSTDATGKTGGKILNNVVKNTFQDGITVYMSDVLVEGNEISGSSSENGALYINSPNSSLLVSNIKIKDNQIYNNNLSSGKSSTKEAGILIGSAVDTNSVLVNNNEIFNNSPWGLSNHASSQLNAKNNWWGYNSGPLDTDNTDGSNPADNPTGQGNTVFGNADYSDWLTTPYIADAVQGRVYDDTNANGYQTQTGRNDGTQLNLFGETVRLYSADFLTIEAEETTAPADNPRYIFENVEEGTHNLCVVLKDNYYQTWPQIGDVPLMLDGSTIYSDGIKAVPNSSSSGSEGHACWEIEVKDGDGFDTYVNLKFGIKAAQTMEFGQEVTGTYGQTERDGIPACNLHDHVYTNQADGSNRSRQVLEWIPVTGATSYEFRSFRWNGSSWIPTGNSAVAISANPDFEVDGYDIGRFENTAGYPTYTELDSVNNVFRYITMGTAEGIYTRSVAAYNGDILMGESTITESDLLGAVKNNFNVCSKLTIDRTKPDAPELIFPENNSFVQGDSLTSDWSDVGGAVKYIYESYHDEETKNLRWREEYIASQKTATNVADATFWWRVKAVDAAGNESEWSKLWKVTVDNTAPAMPTNLTRFSKNGSIEYQCDVFTTLQTLIPNWSDASIDDPSFSHYEYTSFNVGGVIGIDKRSVYTNKFEHNWVPTIEGTYGFAVRSVDKAGNKSPWALSNTDEISINESCQITYDSTVPSVDITSHSSDDLVKGVVNISGQIEDINLWRYWFVIEDSNGTRVGGLNTVYNDGPTVNLNYEWDTTALNDGEYTIKLEARDKAENKDAGSVDWVTVVVDNTAPVVSITSHADGSYLSGEEIILGEIIEDNISHYNLSLYEDKDGLCNKESTWNFSNRVWQKQVNGSNVVEQNLDTTTFENGHYMIRLAARDLAGNRDPMVDSGTGDSVEVICVTIDNEAPIVSGITITKDGQPAEFIKAGDEIVVKAKVVDELSGVQLVSADFSFDKDYTSRPSPTSVKMFDQGNDFYEVTYTVPENWDQDQIFITVAAKDHEGNRSANRNLALEIVVDNTVPFSEISFPENTESGDTVYLTQWDGTISGTAEDILSGLEKVELEIQRESDSFYWNGADGIWQTDSYLNLTSSTDEFANWSFSFTPEADEVYYLTSHATDKAGNFEESYNITVVFDKTIPNVELTIEPANPDGSGSWYITKPTLTMTANDPSNSGLDHLQYQWNSKSDSGWKTVNANGTNSAIASTQPPQEGHSILYYRATDIAGNTFSDTGVKNIYWDATDLTEGPLNVKADPNPTSGSTSTISWTKAEDNIGISKYKVTWDLRDGDDDHSDEVSGNTNELKISDLQEGTYKVTVTAYDNAGHKKSASTDLVVNRTAPAAPTLTLVGTGAGTATLSWNEVDGADDYIILYGTQAGNYQYAARVGNVTQYTVEGLTAGSYFFVVRAVDNVDNQSANSNEVNTGAILGAAGAAAGPAAGFVEAGDVLGDQTDQEPTEEEMERVKAEAENGEVLGEQISCSPLKNYLPWIILGLQLIILLGAEIIMRRDSSAVKMVIALGTTIVAIALYYLLRNNSCYADGSLTMIIDRFFWLASGLLSVIVRFLGYGFIEVVDKE